MKKEPILFFDGHCHLCQGSVQFILKREKEAQFYFSPLQSELAQEILPEGLPDSLIVYEKGKIRIKSDAALYMAFACRFPWPLFNIFRIIPVPIRDFIYDLIARNRYRWFGHTETCMMPQAGWEKRFL
jgi:predicted DCC family thiol-disulfide oxidoreductase YuxK